MDETKTDADRYLVPGLMRGLAVLDAFKPDRPEMGLSEIARVLGLSRSAAFRTVYTLTHLGYLLCDPRGHGYRLGPAVLRLGHGYMAARELVEVALPELERLRDEIDWSAHLGVRDGDRVLYLLRVPSRMGLGSIVHVGSRLPATATTMGRVLLADLDEETLVAVCRDGAGERGMAGIVDQWRRDRATESVVQIGSFERGVASVAAGVRDMSGGLVAAINATRAVQTPEEVEPRVIAAVRDCARRISTLLGHA